MATTHTSYLARTKRHFAFQIAPEREHFGEVGLMVGFDYRRGVVDTTVLSRLEVYREIIGIDTYHGGRRSCGVRSGMCVQWGPRYGRCIPGSLVADVFHLPRPRAVGSSARSCFSLLRLAISCILAWECRQFRCPCCYRRSIYSRYAQPAHHSCHNPHSTTQG